MAEKHFDWTEPFLAALRQMPVLVHACQAVGIDRTSVWRRKQHDAEFAEAVELAMEEGIDRAEQEAFRRGVTGFEEPVVYQGSIAPLMAPVVDANGAPVIDELTKTQKWAPVRDARGRPVPLTVRKHSDALLALILKGRRKKVYAERTELTGADGTPVAVDTATRAARVAELVALAQKRAATEPAVPDIDDIV